MNPLLALPILAALGLGSLSTPAEETQTIAVTVPQADKLAIRIPANWKQNTIQPPHLPPTVQVETGDGGLSLLLTFLPDPKGIFGTKENVDRIVTSASQRYVAGSVEKRITLTQFTSNLGHGSYATFIDAKLAEVPNPPAGEYRNVLTGVFVIQKQAVSVTLLSNTTTGPEYRRALQVITEGISVP